MLGIGAGDLLLAGFSVVINENPVSLAQGVLVV